MSPILLILIGTLAAIVVLALLNKARFARRVDARIQEEIALAEQTALHRKKLEARIDELRRRADTEFLKNTEEADNSAQKHVEQAERVMTSSMPTVEVVSVKAAPSQVIGRRLARRLLSKDPSLDALVRKILTEGTRPAILDAKTGVWVDGVRVVGQGAKLEAAKAKRLSGRIPQAQIKRAKRVLEQIEAYQTEVKAEVQKSRRPKTG